MPLVKGVVVGYGIQLYLHCLLKYMVICALENIPSIPPSFLGTQIVNIGYGQFKKITPSPFILAFYILLLLITVYYYYMLVTTKYH